MRNIVSAHRSPVSLETDIEWRRVLRRDDFPMIFNAICDLLDELEGLPVWKWAYRGGTLVGVGSWKRTWSDETTYLGPAFGPDGFNVRIRVGNEGDLVEHRFETYDAAHKWANPDGGLFRGRRPA